MSDLNKKQIFFRGMRDGIPIGAGYFACALALGIAARNAGLTPFQAGISSSFLHASAGQYAAYTMIMSDAGYFEAVLMILITNARYFLMSCSMSQKYPTSVGIIPRLIVGHYVTDEIFGITISHSGPVDPWYIYGAVAVASPGWVLGTVGGVLLGNILPARLVSALSVSLFGMFIATVIPPARNSRIMAGLVIVSYTLSLAFSELVIFSGISSGMKTLILTVVIGTAAAILFPVKDEEGEYEA